MILRENFLNFNDQKSNFKGGISAFIFLSIKFMGKAYPQYFVISFLQL